MSQPSKLTFFLKLKSQNVFEVKLTDNFQYHSQFVDTNNITWYSPSDIVSIKKNVQNNDDLIRRGGGSALLVEYTMYIHFYVFIYISYTSKMNPWLISK